MGKIGKPQKSKKQKKIKAIDPFYKGARKGVRSEGLNQPPKNFTQEVPRKLKRLGYEIDGVKKAQAAKNGVQSLQAVPNGTLKYNNKFKSPMGTSSEMNDQSLSKLKKNLEKQQKRKPMYESDKKIVAATKKKGKKKKNKFKDEDIQEYIDKLQPSRPYVPSFTFKKKENESQGKFMKRVEREADIAINRSKFENKFEASDEKKIAKMIQDRAKKREKKTQRLADNKKRKAEALKEKKKERSGGFNALQDKVEFGEVVHAPPVLSVRPKKVEFDSSKDKPGQRMPELQAAIHRNVSEAEGNHSPAYADTPPTPKNTPGQAKTKKRKWLSHGQKIAADKRRNQAIDAYRQMKKSKKGKMKE